MRAQVFELRARLVSSNKPLDVGAHGRSSPLSTVGFEKADSLLGERNRNATLSRTARRRFAPRCPGTGHSHISRMHIVHTTLLLASCQIDGHQGSGSVCCSGALRAPELLENTRPAVGDRRYKNQTDPLPAAACQ